MQGGKIPREERAVNRGDHLFYFLVIAVLAITAITVFNPSTPDAEQALIDCLNGQAVVIDDQVVRCSKETVK